MHPLVLIVFLPLVAAIVAGLGGRGRGELAGLVGGERRDRKEQEQKKRDRSMTAHSPILQICPGPFKPAVGRAPACGGPCLWLSDGKPRPSFPLRRPGK
jgi:hypothetical protein